MFQFISFRKRWVLYCIRLFFIILISASSGFSVSYPARAQDDPPPLSAPPDIGALIQEADLILIGQAVSVLSQLSTNQFNDKLIISDVFIAVQEVLKGSSPGKYVVLQDVPGGKLANVSMHSSNDPFFTQGERVVLFLETGPIGWQVVSGDLGKFTVDTAGQVPAMDLSLAQFRVLIISSVNGWSRFLPLVMNGNEVLDQNLAEWPASTEQVQAPAYVLDGNRWLGNPPEAEIWVNIPGFNDEEAGTFLDQIHAIYGGVYEWELTSRTIFHFNNSYGGSEAPDTVEEDGHNMLLLRNAFKPHDLHLVVLATTYCFTNDDTHEFIDCDIVFWDAQPFSVNGAANSFDIRSVATHQLGHVLGLDASGVNGSSMFPSIRAGTVSMGTLHLDDMKGIKALYGAEMYVQDQSPVGSNDLGDKFGSSFAAANFIHDNYERDDLAVGAPGEDYNGSGPNAGVVFLYDRNWAWDDPIVLSQSPAGSDEAGDRFGSALAAGDFNGDTFADLAVGAPGEDYNDSGPNAGVVFVFEGTGAGVANPVVLSQSGAGANESGDQFGSALAVADFNQDGFDDLVVGVPGENYSGSGNNAGVVFVFTGSDSGLGNPYVLDQHPAGVNESNDRFGQALMVGDFDSDGFIDDLAVGAPGEDYSGSGANAGLVYVFTNSGESLGSPYILSQSPYNDEIGDQFGYALSAGDFDGDGFVDDLAVGAPGEDYHGSGPLAGVVFLFGDASQDIVYAFGQDLAGRNEAGDLFGSALASGDFNGDGIDELAIGAMGENYNGSGSSAGVVYIRQFADDSGGTTDFMMVLDQVPAGSNEATDQFGAALFVLDPIWVQILIIGAPGEAPNDSPASGAWFHWKWW